MEGTRSGRPALHHPRKSEVVVPVPLLGMEKQEGAETPQPSPIPQRPLTVRAAVAPASWAITCRSRSTPSII